MSRVFIVLSLLIFPLLSHASGEVPCQSLLTSELSRLGLAQSVDHLAQGVVRKSDPANKVAEFRSSVGNTVVQYFANVDSGSRSRSSLSDLNGGQRSRALYLNSKCEITRIEMETPNGRSTLTPEICAKVVDLTQDFHGDHPITSRGPLPPEVVSCDHPDLYSVCSLFETKFVGGKAPKVGIPSSIDSDGNIRRHEDADHL